MSERESATMPCAITWGDCPIRPGWSHVCTKDPWGHSDKHTCGACQATYLAGQDGILVDVTWVAKQMRDAGEALTEPPTCWQCDAKGPGLFWLPSEEGVIEMAVWECMRCIALDALGHVCRVYPRSPSEETG